MDMAATSEMSFQSQLVGPVALLAPDAILHPGGTTTKRRWSGAVPCRTRTIAVAVVVPNALYGHRRDHISHSGAGCNIARDLVHALHSCRNNNARFGKAAFLLAVGDNTTVIVAAATTSAVAAAAAATSATSTSTVATTATTTVAAARRRCRFMRTSWPLCRSDIIP